MNRYLAAACQTDFPNPADRSAIGDRVRHMLGMIDHAVIGYRPFGDVKLVVWGGEFGRTPMVEANPTLGRSLGRDHHPQAYTIWMAGGGIKPGVTLGKTDDLGFHPAEGGVHVHDVQATILNQLGFDHEKLTYRHAGRDFRLTDVFGKVIKEALA